MATTGLLFTSLPPRKDGRSVHIHNVPSGLVSSASRYQNGNGLDRYRFRRHDTWYRRITLAVLAHGCLCVAAATAGLAAAALVSAVIPAAAGLAFLISLAARRPRHYTAPLPA
jgi:hypothetical protein